MVDVLLSTHLKFFTETCVYKDLSHILINLRILENGLTYFREKLLEF